MRGRRIKRFLVGSAAIASSAISLVPAKRAGTY